jgi:hypothetical protein
MDRHAIESRSIGLGGHDISFYITVSEENIIIQRCTRSCYACETPCFTLSSEHRLRVLEESVFRILGPKKAEVIGRRKLYSEKLHTSSSRQKCIRVMNSGIIRRERLTTRMGGIITYNLQNFSENLKTTPYKMVSILQTIL